MPGVIEAIKSAYRSTTLTLENEGSVARDHLASERTFLAWLRTSLSLVSIGIAVTQLFKIPSLVGTKTLSLWIDDAESLSDPSPHLRLQALNDIAKLGKPIGGGFIVLGIFVLLLGSRRYFSVQRTLTTGKFEPSRIEVSLTAIFAGSLIVAALAVLVAGKRT